MRWRKAVRLFFIFLGLVFGITALLFVILNLPFLDGFVTKQSNEILNKANVPIHVEAIKRVMPYSVKIQGILISDPEGDTIIHVGELRTNCKLRALVRKKVILKDLDLDQASVELLMNYDTRKLNIAEAFTGGKKPQVNPAEKMKAAWEISVKKGKLSSVHFRMSDSISGTHILQDISGMKLKNFTVSLRDHELVANTLELEHLVGDIAFGPARELENQGKKQGSPWNFGLMNLSMKDIHFGYSDSSAGFSLETILGEGIIRADKMDMSRKIIDLKRISLSGVTTNISTGNRPGKSQVKKETGPENFPWNIKSKAIVLEDMNIAVGKEYSPVMDSGDHNFSMSGLNVKLKDFLLYQDHAGVQIDKLVFALNNGLTVKELEGDLESVPGSTKFNLALETEHSKLKVDALSQEGFFGMISAPEEIEKAVIRISNTELSLEDISYFIPELKQQSSFAELAAYPYSLNGEVGIVNTAYTFSGFTLSQDHNFRLGLDGLIDNPLQSSEARGELTLSLSDIDTPWLNSLMAVFGVEQGIPEYASLSIKGTLSESIVSPEFHIELESNLGNLNAVGSMNFDTDSFAIHSILEQVELGEILNNKELGAFSGEADFSGRSFSFDTLQANFSLLLDTFSFHGYQYRQAKLTGKLSPGSYEVDIQVDDPSLKADLAAIMKQGDSMVELKASGSISAQLNALKFYSDTLYLESALDGHLMKSISELETGFSLRGISLHTPQDSAIIQNINGRFKTDSLGSMLIAEADFFQLDLKSSRPFSEIDSIGQAYANYFATFTDQHHEHASTRVQQLPGINASGEIRYHDALGLFFQDTGLFFNNLKFSVINIPSDQRIDYKINGKAIEYGFMKIGNLNTSISDTAGILNIQITADDNTINSSPANELRIKSRFEEGHSLSELTLLDKQNRTIYGIEVTTRLDSQNILFSIPSRELILNHSHWQMDSTSLFSLNTRSKAISPNLRMHTDSSFFHLITQGKDEDYEYKLILNKVSLHSLLQDGLISGNPDGLLSGSLRYDLTGDGEQRLNSDLEVRDLHWSGLNYKQIDLDGTFKIDSSKAYVIDMSALLDSSKLIIKGEKIYGGSGSVQADFSSVPIRTFQPFVKDHLSGLRGDLSGKINLSTKGDQDNILGELYIRDAHLKINSLNATYRIPEDSIRFSGERIVFDKFSVIDSLNNKLFVDGFIGFGDHWSPYASLEVSSSKLQVMNRSEKEDVSLYGNIFVDSRLSFNGPLTNPDIKGQIFLTEGTDVYYRYMEDLSLSETEKILSFVDYSSTDGADTGSPVRMTGTAMNSSIETIVKIDPATKINFNLAKRIYNINIMIKGGGTLNYNMLNNNQVALSGKYEIRDGTADMKLIGWPNKAFQIAEGGYIRWDGLFDNPELNFEALSKVSSSYTNPVDGKLRYVDFNVILRLSQQLSDLDILFTINTSDQYLMSIINTLSPEEQMRQAITILLFEYVDLPGISTSSNYMSQQVSQLLASQLNELAKTTIQGVDISFGIDTYTQASATGAEETKTSLSYEVRKNFLNDRAQIEFSGRLDDLTQQTGNTDFSMNNLSFEYRLDSAASKFLKVYNEHSYEDVFTGEVVKTGVGFTYRKRYQYFKDIWRRKNRAKVAEPGDK